MKNHIKMESSKVYTLVFSRKYPPGHSKSRHLTKFAEKMASGEKLHAVRSNYVFWKRRIDEVNAGRAVLSVREWTGRPYASEQRELFRLDRGSGIGVERLDSLTPVRTAPFDSNGECTIFLSVGGVEVDVETLAANEGLTFEDFEEWWKDFDRSRPLAIVHLTPHRYAARGGKTEGVMP